MRGFGCRLIAVSVIVGVGYDLTPAVFGALIVTPLVELDNHHRLHEPEYAISDYPKHSFIHYRNRRFNW